MATIHSMTGFAAVSREISGRNLTLELRSVNSRFLDLHFRVADELRLIEPQLRELISSKISRGKVDCRMGFAESPGETRQSALDDSMLSRLAGLQHHVKTIFPEAAPLSVGEVLRWPGVMGDAALPFEVLQIEALAMTRQALAELQATREREGRKLGAMLTERTTRMRERVAEVVPRLPEIQRAYHERIVLRLREALGTADDERVRQEVALFAARIDVAEELSRLSTHLDETDRVIDAGGAVGKRLDFLMQELNREANTLGSKSAAPDISAIAMELKLLIEQMREQVQNLE